MNYTPIIIKKKTILINYEIICSGKSHYVLPSKVEYGAYSIAYGIVSLNIGI